MVFPDSEELREKYFTELGRASGHSNKKEVWKFYPTPQGNGANSHHTENETRGAVVYLPG